MESAILFWENLVFLQTVNPLDLVASLETTDKVIHCFSYNQQIREGGKETNL